MMTQHSTHPQTPPTFMLPFFKLPFVIYDLGLGWMLGRRFVLLKHKGRKSGKVYRSVLAVLNYDEATREIRVVSPWNTSNWWRNIQAAPAVEVEMGRVRYAPVHRALTAEEIAELFIRYRRERPVFSRMVSRIPGWNIDSTYDEFLELAKTLRGVAFTPRPTE